MILFGLLGMSFSPDGLTFQPILPEGVTPFLLDGLRYHQQTLNLRVTGQGKQIGSFSINGQKQERPFLSNRRSGAQEIEIHLA